jgi:hypothetical protein
MHVHRALGPCATGMAGRLTRLRLTRPSDWAMLRPPLSIAGPPLTRATPRQSGRKDAHLPDLPSPLDKYLPWMPEFREPNLRPTVAGSRVLSGEAQPGHSLGA